MARKNGKNPRREGPRKPLNSEPWFDVHPDIRRVVFAVGAFIFAALFAISYIGKGGTLGSYLYWAFDFLLGSGYFLVPVIFVLLGFSFLFSERSRVFKVTLLGGCAFLISSLGLFDLLIGSGVGGALGALIARPLLRLFDFWGGFIISFGVWIISGLLLFNIPFWNYFRRDREGEEEASESDGPGRIQTALESVGSVFE